MRRIVTGIYILFCLGAVALSLEAGETVSIAELISHTQKYDGQRVTIRGEIIGDIINVRDTDCVWVNICEQNNIAIGVFCPKQLVEGITYRGSYNYIGDQVLVQGVFHRACPIHNSEVDIHAQDITVVEGGRLVGHPVELSKLRLSKRLSAIAIVLALVHLVYYGRKQRKKHRL